MGKKKTGSRAHGEARQEKREPRETSALQDLARLLIKILLIMAAFWALFTFVFGVHRYVSANMTPAMRDGDLIFYYRLDHDLRAEDVIVVQYHNRTILGRVVAVEGDSVDIDAEGLVINGSHVQELSIFTETTQFEGGVTFPLTVGPDQVFILGDNRPVATDSRMFGCVDKSDVLGKVIGLLRRRGL